MECKNQSKNYFYSAKVQVRVGMMKQMISKAGFLLMLSLTFLMPSCGVYSHLRPADTLKQGNVELSGGVSASYFGEVLPVFQAAVGATDWLEMYGHYEMRSGYGGMRLGLLKSEKHPIALSIGGHAGIINRFEDKEGGELFGYDYVNRFAYGPSISIGRKFKHLEPYLSAVVFFDQDGLALGSEKLGLRWYITPELIWGLELGSAQHAKLFSSTTTDGLATFEGATFLSFLIH